ncbi:MAG TPA: ketopantoate reductase C-terminal domain-containing protein [Rhizobiaceae bacterium]|nr:ketopantoate reductase C-terminal domain-containing protein [Rhizobiaceae bacterium]
MVPFNVVQVLGGEAPAFRRATSGQCLVQTGSPSLADFLDVEGAPFGESGDMEAVLWGKLLLNLNNALNALSGLPLAEQLADRHWRRILADQIAEALSVMRDAGVRPASAGGPSPSLVPAVLRLPDFIFKWLARRMLSVDPAARSSMWEDFERRRRTEIDEFQGAIVRLAEATGGDAPLSRQIVALVHEAEKENRGSPGLSADMVLRQPA